MSLSVLMVVASEDDGGMARVVHTLARDLAACGLTVHVAVHREAPLTDWLRQEAIDYTVVPTLIETPTRPRADGRSGMGAAIRNLAGLGAATRSVRALADRVGADVIYSHNTWSHYVAAAAAQLPGLPRPASAPERELEPGPANARNDRPPPAVVWHMHNDHSRWPTRTIDRQVARRAGVAAILAVSASIGAPFAAGPAPLTVVTNGIDLAASDGARRTPRLRAALGLEPSARVAVYAGRLVAHKGIHVLLEAARIAVHAMPTLHVAVLGGTPRHAATDVLADLRTMVEGWRLGGRIHLLGHVTDVQSHMADADMAIVPSICADGYPLAAIEALCLGVPVVASRIGGLPELVRDQVDGVLVPPGDRAGLADAIIRLARDPQRRQRMSQAAEAGRDRFDARATARRVAEVLHRAAGQRAPAG